MVAPNTPLIVKTADNPDGVDRRVLEGVLARLSKDRQYVIATAAPAFFGAPINSVSTEMMQWWTNMILKCSLRVLLDPAPHVHRDGLSARASKISLRQ